MGATLRFAFLFFEFFIPYVCILWIVFGGDENAENIEKISQGDGEQFRTFDEIVSLLQFLTERKNDVFWEGRVHLLQYFCTEDLIDLCVSYWVTKS